MSQVFRLSPRIPVNVQMPPPIIYLVYKNAILVSQSPCLVWAGRESKHTILLVAIEVLEKTSYSIASAGIGTSWKPLTTMISLSKIMG